MKAAPKQVLKVAVGSVTPISVPATLAVYPDRKWYIAWSAVRREIGGNTPKASAVRKMMVEGGGPRFFSLVLGMNSIGYAPRVFSVLLASVKSSSRVSSSIVTFSRMVPNILVVA